MTKQEFFKCLDLARSPDFEPLPYLGFELTSLFQTLNTPGRHDVTREQVASIIHGEARTFAGTWCTSALESLQERARYWRLIDLQPALPWVVWYEPGHPDGSPARAFFEFEHDARAFAELRSCAEIERVLT
jgi:hypothetical protein